MSGFPRLLAQDRYTNHVSLAVYESKPQRIGCYRNVAGTPPCSRSLVKPATYRHDVKLPIGNGVADFLHTFDILYRVSQVAVELAKVFLLTRPQDAVATETREAKQQSAVCNHQHDSRRKRIAYP